MTTAVTASNGRQAQHYDRLTIFFHWATVFLVVGLFVLAQIWEFLPKGTPVRRLLQWLHISFGLLFAVVFLLRILWRVSLGRRLPPVASGLMQRAASSVHGVFYLLLAAQIVLGFLFRWAQGESFTFFGLFAVPTLIQIDHEQRQFIGGLHNYVGWAIIVLAVGHACFALFHHYVLRDGVLRRMTSCR